MAGTKPFHASPPTITPASPMSTWAPWTNGIYFDPDDDGGGGTGGTQDPPPGDDGNGGGEDPPPAKFTQDQLDAITKQRLEREQKKQEQERKRLLELAGVETIEDLEKKAQEREKRRKEQLLKEKKYQELLDSQKSEFEQERQKYMQELEQLRKSRASELKTRTLVEAANTHDAINASQVARLLSDRVTVTEDGNLAVLDESGEPALGDDMKPLAVSKLVETFLSENKHFQKGAGGAGANSGGGSGGGPNPPVIPGSDGQTFDYERALRDNDYALKHYDQFVDETQRRNAG